jgi:hypothetical protein
MRFRYSTASARLTMSLGFNLERKGDRLFAVFVQGVPERDTQQLLVQVFGIFVANKSIFLFFLFHFSSIFSFLSVLSH